MSEAKILTPHDLGGLGSGFDVGVEKGKNSAYPNQGLKTIDTLSSTTLKTTVNKRVSKAGFFVEKVKKHSKISRAVKQKALSKEITSLHYVTLPSGFSNVILETPSHLNKESDYRKVKITAFGLASPAKPLQASTLHELQTLFDGLNIVSIDIAYDFKEPLDFSKLKSYGKIEPYFGTRYLNRPRGLSYIERVIYYNKSHKDGLGYPLYRLEFRCKTHGKLGSGVWLPVDEIETVLNTLQIGTQNRRDK